MPDLPRATRLSLQDAIGYITDRCKCDLIKAGKAVLAALSEGVLVASANVLVSDRSYEAGIVHGPIPVGPPKRVDAGIQTVPSKVWAGYPWPSFQMRALHPRGNPQYRQHTADGGQIGPVYVNPTIATADIDSWVNGEDRHELGPYLGDQAGRKPKAPTGPPARNRRSVQCSRSDAVSRSRTYFAGVPSVFDQGGVADRGRPDRRQKDCW